jgi:predicted permease
LLIAATGGVLGILVAYAGVRLLVASAPIDVPRLDEASLNLTSVVFAFLLAGTSGVLCGIWPAIRAMGAEPADALRAAATRSSTESAARQSWREWLVGVEVALSTVLLVLTALLWVSFVRLTGVHTGYSVERILTADVSLPGSRYGTDEKKAQFHRNAIEKLESIPGVRSAALISSLPLKAQMWGDTINKEGDARPLAERPIAHFRFLSERYFETMGIALKRGRYPVAQDRENDRRVAVISESSAQRAWPGEDPVGRFLVQDNRKQKVEIVGVVADVRTESLDKEPPLMVYVPYWDGKFWQGEVWGSMTYVLRTSQAPESVAGALRAAIRELDAELPVSNVLTMREIFSESVGSRRFQTLLASVFGVGALLLACLGVYGVISYSVARRTNEIGIRIALGAQASQVSMLVMRQGLRPVIGGILIGVAVSLWVGQWISSLLFGTGARDPLTILSVVAALLVAGSLACWVPARRACRVDPMSALRAE